MYNTRVEQTTASTGTGSLDLQSPATGRRTAVSAIGSGVNFYYILQNSDESEWEEGIGYVTSGSPDVLTRSSVIQSSNSNSLVNFSSGVKTLYCGYIPDQVRFGGPGALPSIGGSANALTASFSPAIRHLRAGMLFGLVPTADNTTAATVAFNSISAVDIVRVGGSALSAGDLRNGHLAWLFYNGTKCLLLNPQPQMLSGLTLAVPGALNLASPVTIASASTVNIGAAASNDINISGTTTITAFDTVAAGVTRRLYFSGDLQLTHNATNMILIGRQSIQIKAGDIAEFKSLGSGNWLMMSMQRGVTGFPLNSAYAIGARKNLVVQNNSGSPNTQMDVTADSLVLWDSNNVGYQLNNVNENIQSGTAGAGGLDTGSLSSNTWYSLWIIRNSSSGAIEGLMSLSATAPTMPSGYDQKARVGWVRVGGAGVFLPIYQKGNRVDYNSKQLMGNGTSGTYDSSRTAIAWASFVPPTVAVIHGSLLVTGTVNVNGAACSPTSTGAATAKHSPNSSECTIPFSIVPQSSSIYWSSGGSSNVIYCNGWEDNL